MDALQVMLDATTGKKGVFSTRAGDEGVSRYTVDGVRPLSIVMRVNDWADACEGILLGFAFDRTNQKSKIWDVAEVERLDCVKVLKEFAGDASFARRLTAPQADPYKLVWDQ